MIMKKLIFAVAFAFLGTFAFAQNSSGWGLKGGFNFNSNGDIVQSAQNISADSKVGFHLGAFGKLKFSGLYVRPELVYTKTKSEYSGSDFDMSKIDVPLLVGVDILGPVSIFGGPAFQYILNTDLDNVTLGDVENDFTVGLNFGVALSLNENIGVDLRYERGLSDNEAAFAGIEDSGRLDTRPSQVILSLSVKL